MRRSDKDDGREASSTSSLIGTPPRGSLPSVHVRGRTGGGQKAAGWGGRAQAGRLSVASEGAVQFVAGCWFRLLRDLGLPLLHPEQKGEGLEQDNAWMLCACPAPAWKAAANRLNKSMGLKSLGALGCLSGLKHLSCKYMKPLVPFHASYMSQ